MCLCLFSGGDARAYFLERGYCGVGEANGTEKRLSIEINS